MKYVCSIAASFALQYLTIKYQTKSTTCASAQIMRSNTFLFFAELRKRASIKVSSIYTKIIANC